MITVSKRLNERIAVEDVGTDQIITECPRWYRVDLQSWERKDCSEIVEDVKAIEEVRDEWKAEGII
jgi:hypothetical protein